MNEPKKGTTSSSDAKMLSKTLFDLVFLPRCSQTLLLLFDSKRIYDAFAMMHYTAAVTTNNHLHQMRFFFFPYSTNINDLCHDIYIYICRCDNDVLLWRFENEQLRFPLHVQRNSCIVIVDTNSCT